MKKRFSDREIVKNVYLKNFYTNNKILLIGELIDELDSLLKKSCLVRRLTTKEHVTLSIIDACLEMIIEFNVNIIVNNTRSIMSLSRSVCENLLILNWILSNSDKAAEYYIA